LLGTVEQVPDVVLSFPVELPAVSPEFPAAAVVLLSDLEVQEAVEVNPEQVEVFFEDEKEPEISVEQDVQEQQVAR
jgi:hypothetical protein